MALVSKIFVKVDVERLMENLLNHFLGLKHIEGVEFCCQNIQNDAQTPDVRTEAVGLTAVHLRRNIAKRANAGLLVVTRVLQVDRHAEVTDLDRGLSLWS